jgi:hypothetical protein
MHPVRAIARARWGHLRTRDPYGGRRPEATVFCAPWFSTKEGDVLRPVPATRPPCFQAFRRRASAPATRTCRGETAARQSRTVNGESRESTLSGVDSRPSESGRQDLNLRPLGPEAFHRLCASSRESCCITEAPVFLPLSSYLTLSSRIARGTRPTHPRRTPHPDRTPAGVSKRSMEVAR